MKLELAPRRPYGALLLAGFALYATAAGADEEPRSALRTVSGEVVAVRELPAEDGLSNRAIDLRPDDDAAGTGDLTVVLAPPSALDEIGFEVSPGDRVRVRIFVEADRVARAHKIVNTSRGLTVRLRTLSTTPLWDRAGNWRGGECEGRGYRGGRGGGGGPRGRGRGPGR